MNTKTLYPTIRYYIGIDPDIKASGLAVYDVQTKSFIRLETMSFPRLVTFLNEWQAHHHETIIIIEAGWLISHTWHKSKNTRHASAIGKSVGANHQTGRHLLELALHLNYTTCEQVPLQKIWRGKDRKITHEEFVSLRDVAFAPSLERCKTRTNQEMRDAGLIALHYLNTPILRPQTRQ